MARASWTKYLEVSTNIAVLVVAAALLSALISARLAMPAKPAFERGLHKGQMMPNFHSVNYGPAARTLLLSLNARCEFCQESLPFYRRLIEEERKAPGKFSLVAVFSNREAEVQDYKQRNQLEMKSVANVNPSSINLAGTPTLILVDAEGRVSDLWVGKLSDAEEEQVIRTLQLN